MTIVEQYDACNPDNLAFVNGHKSSVRVAGYLDGPCVWPGEGWSKFPGRPKVRITTTANDLADVYDWEHGTAPLSAVKAQVLFRAKAYLPSAVYCDEASWEEAFGKLEGLPVVWWVAAWGAAAWPVLKVGARTIRAAAWQELSWPTYDASHVDAEAWPVLGEPAP